MCINLLFNRSVSIKTFQDSRQSSPPCWSRIKYLKNSKLWYLDIKLLFWSSPHFSCRNTACVLNYRYIYLCKCCNDHCHLWKYCSNIKSMWLSYCTGLPWLLMHTCQCRQRTAHNQINHKLLMFQDTLKQVCYFKNLKTVFMIQNTL